MLMNDTDLLRIAAFIKDLNEIYHNYSYTVQDFDNNEYEIIGDSAGEVIGVVQMGEDGEFEFAPGKKI